MGWLTGYIGVMTSQPTVKWWANGLADRVHWSDDQLADCGVVGLMGWPTVKWWSDRLANRVCWSDDQLADCGVVGPMGWLTYIGVMTSQLTGYVGVMTSWPTVGLVG